MDYYQILQIDRSAPVEEIKKAYRKLSRKYHPDNAGEGSRDMFEKVQEAYMVLSDEEKRSGYDQRYVQKPKSSLEQFFGFKSAGKEKKQNAGPGPVNTDQLFESFFKIK